ncbi:MAG: hypothetical protein WA126_10950 [Thermodesulfovibrionales bacterium]
MLGKDISDKPITLILFLLFFIFFAGFIILFNYVGIPLGDKENDGDMNFIAYCLGFISLLFAWRVLYLIFFRKTDGDWTKEGKAQWRYCVVGTLAMALISTPIEYLNIPELPKRLLEVVMVLGLQFISMENIIKNISTKLKLIEGQQMKIMKGKTGIKTLREYAKDRHLMYMSDSVLYDYFEEPK